MLIFDSSTIIAIFNELKLVTLIDKVMLLDDDLVIPSNLARAELIDPRTRSSVEKCVDEKKLRIICANTPEEIQAFRSIELMATSAGLGELDVILTYEKHKSTISPICCVLDDKAARDLASKLGIETIGLVGILRLLRDKSILDDLELNKIMAVLRRSGFRLGRDLNI